MRGNAKKWTDEEIDILREKWGEVSINTICKLIKRPIGSIRYKAYKLKLGCSYNISNLTSMEAARILNVDGKRIRYLIKHYNLPVRRVKYGLKREFIQISLDQFIKWLKNNQKRWDSRRVEINALGSEPEWLRQKRKADLKRRVYKKWTQWEDTQLIKYLNEGLNQTQIARKMKRCNYTIHRHLKNIIVTPEGLKVAK